MGDVVHRLAWRFARLRFWYTNRRQTALPGPPPGVQVVQLSPGQRITDPEEAEALGLRRTYRWTM